MQLASACLICSLAVFPCLVSGSPPRTHILVRLNLEEPISVCPSRPPWTNHPPTGRACGWPLQGPWLDHRSSTTAYGLTRCACRTAFFVGVEEIQRKPGPWTPSWQSWCLLWCCGPAPRAAGHGPAPSGLSPEESGADRQTRGGQSAINRPARANDIHDGRW